MFMDYFHFIGHFFPVSCHLLDPVFWWPPWHWTSLPTRLPAFTLTPVLCSLHSRSCDPYVKTKINPITSLQCYSSKKKNQSPYCKLTNTHMSYHSATPATGAYLLIWEHTQNLPISRFLTCSSPAWNFSLTCSLECLVSSLTYPIRNSNSFAHNSGISLFF